ncbi:hypothetical protein BpHYR1_014606 [Brachionus plicatilis]|uniref:Uncharacterized protein n=1 Tax=Brachionus plicatilis TaxID=10195 RepID=A0A3M7PVI6_BRAPC|nr:hypothetical protein BpHYR1_014606 [Brachionus plicatilis]
MHLFIYSEALSQIVRRIFIARETPRLHAGFLSISKKASTLIIKNYPVEPLRPYFDKCFL